MPAATLNGMNDWSRYNAQYGTDLPDGGLDQTGGCAFAPAWHDAQCLPPGTTGAGGWVSPHDSSGGITVGGLWIPPPQLSSQQAYAAPPPCPDATPYGVPITPSAGLPRAYPTQQPQQGAPTAEPALALGSPCWQQPLPPSSHADDDDAAMALPPRLAGGIGEVLPFGGRVQQEEELLRGPALTTSWDLDDDGAGLIPAQSLGDQGKLVVVLDLDETLVRFREGPVHWRPCLAEFLDSIKSCCEVVLWTASTEECAQRVMGTLDPDGDRLHHKVYRTDRWFKGVPYTKDLTLLNRDMRRVVIIENTFECVASNPQNAILVTDYIVPDPDDVALRIVRDLCVAIAEDPCISVPEYLPRQQDVLTGGMLSVLGQEGTFYCVTQEAQNRRRREWAAAAPRIGGPAAAPREGAAAAAVAAAAVAAAAALPPAGSAKQAPLVVVQ